MVCVSSPHGAGRKQQARISPIFSFSKALYSLARPRQGGIDNPTCALFLEGFAVTGAGPSGPWFARWPHRVLVGHGFRHEINPADTARLQPLEYGFSRCHAAAIAPTISAP